MMAKIFSSQVYLAAVATVVTLSATSEAFKLPSEVKVTDEIDPWMDMKSYSNVERDPSNSIPVSPRRRLMKYPENVGYSDGEDGNDMTGLPLLISFRSQDGQPQERLVSYETEKSKGLERFYKHSVQESGTGERIVFPSEDADHAHESIAASSNGDDGQYARMDSRTRERNPYHESSTSGEEDSKKAAQEQYAHSLESLAQIVRHLLFRSPVSQVFDSVPETTSSGSSHFEYEPSENGPEGSTSMELEVKDQSLYNGPKLRSSGSGDCPEGYKKTRNGMCQKPSRRLMAMSR